LIEAPVYFLWEASHYLRLPASTVRSWLHGREYPRGRAVAVSEPIVHPADPETGMLSFLNLVELHVLSSIRRGHQVKLPAVRRAVDYLREKLHSDHPLIDRQMLTDGKDLFIEQYGQLVSVSEPGQLAMKALLLAHLRRIERDAKGVPLRLFPFTRSRIEQSPRLVVIDPQIRFGKPCITGTGVPTSIIAERHEAGDSFAELAEDYGRSTEEIEEAIRYESRAAS
jgi:uncharacterized protein (DUF433 family)